MQSKSRRNDAKSVLSSKAMSFVIYIVTIRTGSEFGHRNVIVLQLCLYPLCCFRNNIHDFKESYVKERDPGNEVGLSCEWCLDPFFKEVVHGNLDRSCPVSVCYHLVDVFLFK